MATEARTDRHSDIAIPPGELLAEELEARDLSQADLARRIGRPPQAISEIVRGRKRITAGTALDLEAALGIPARLWLNLQSTYDLALARGVRSA